MSTHREIAAGLLAKAGTAVDWQPLALRAIGHALLAQREPRQPPGRSYMATISGSTEPDPAGIERVALHRAARFFGDDTPLRVRQDWTLRELAESWVAHVEVEEIPEP